MPTRERDILLSLIDQGFDQTAWHGPNLRNALRGVKPEEAVYRPQPKRHNVAEHVLHAAYWKYTVRRRLLKEKRGSFGRKGSNWFRVDGPLTRVELAEMIELLADCHARLRAAVEAALRANALPEAELSRVVGIAMHDVYHAGQIRLLRAQYQGQAPKRRRAARPTEGSR